MKKNHIFSLYNLFGFIIFLGAFLLFQVQPIIGKYILPWFGGTSFVWITSLLFFQTLLLLGYAYAFFITKVSLKQQLYIHLFLVVGITTLVIYAFSIWPTPLTPPITWKLADSLAPTLQVLGILCISIGMPYFLLSTTSTLLQKWFSQTSSEKTPYTLYAISNAGSLLAIGTYPFLFEPLLKLQANAFLWSVTFIVYALSLGVLTLVLWKKKMPKEINNAVNRGTNKSSISSHSLFFWFTLPAVSSLLLLTLTNQISQFVAPIPFLWLLPLGLYLISFILAFSDKRLVNQSLYAYGTIIFIPFLIAFLLLAASLFIQLAIYAFFLFFSFMLFHTELYKRRPDPEHLNMFYLVIAAGSVAGAGIVAIIAPLFFKGMYWEFYLGLLLSFFFAIIALVSGKKLNRQRFIIFNIIIFFIFFGLIAAIETSTTDKEVYRNFYGTLRITEVETSKGDMTCLSHGKIMHGCQLKSSDPALRNKLITYYSEKSGIPHVITSLRERNKAKGKQSLRIGVVGLGVGTAAAYGKKNDLVKFYELNPVDIAIAQNKFTYMKDSPATIQITQGDARLSMEKELKQNKKQNFDILLLDAFNDDAVPVHLITKEAFALYRQHLASDGSVIAVNISTFYLDLRPVIEQIAKHYNMHVIFVKSTYYDQQVMPTVWAFISSEKDTLDTPELSKIKQRNLSLPQIKLWTDDYSNIFQLIKY